MENNIILSKYQSRFRKQYSCETEVNNVINRWKKQQKKQQYFLIFEEPLKRSIQTF